MCLVILAWQQHAEYPLIIAGNRDEFHNRPTQGAHWWPDHPDIVGGRDLLAGGTWFALHRSGRFATVTNFRDAVKPSAKFRSRGHLVSDFLLGNDAPMDYCKTIDGPAYAGFNLLLGDGQSLAWYSNRAGDARELGPGLYGLSNALLDSPWHKVRFGKSTLQQLIASGNVNETTVFRLLNDRSMAPVDAVEADHLPFAKARAISAPFIVLPDYGTRSSSVVLLDNGRNWAFSERRFSPDGKRSGDAAFRFQAPA